MGIRFIDEVLMGFHWLDSLADSFLPHAAPLAGRPMSLQNDQKRFWHAVQKEDIDTVEEIAHRYPDSVMTWESSDGTPLKTAQAWGCFESFVQLMSMGADKNQDYGGGWTPLLTAIASGDKLFIEFIAGHKPDYDAVAVDGKGRPRTAFQLAIDNRDMDTVRLLIEQGANAKLEIETGDGTKMLPADYARAKHQPKIAEMLDLADEIRSLYAKRFAPEPLAVTASPAPLAPSP